ATSEPVPLQRITAWLSPSSAELPEDSPAGSVTADESSGWELSSGVLSEELPEEPLPDSEELAELDGSELPSPPFPQAENPRARRSASSPAANFLCTIDHPF